MKIKNLLLVVVAVFAAASVSAAPVGSIIKKAVPFPVDVDGVGTPFPAGAVCDFKAASVNGKLWAKGVGTGYTLAANPWSTQVRIWNPGLFEISPNTSAQFISVNTGTRTTVVTGYTHGSISQIAFLQEDNNIFYQTEAWAYDPAAPNSGLTDDTEAPVLTSAVEGTQVGTRLPVTLAATDNSGDFFYYISDEDKNFHTILFDNTGTLELLANTSYTLSVVAIDFAGNISEAQTIQVGEAEFESVVDGVAGGDGDVEFRIYSTANSFTIYAKPAVVGNQIYHFLVQVGTPATVFGKEDPTPVAVISELIPGETGWFSKTINEVAGDADGIVRLQLGYRTDPILEFDPGSQLFWDDFHGKIIYTSKLSTGEFIDFKLGDSSEEDRPTGIQAPVVDKAEKARQYFTIDGRAVTEPTFGIYIVKKIYVDGSVATEKVLVQ